MSAELRGLPAGRYTVEWWDTLTGQVLCTDTVTADATGTLRLRVPDFVNDIAGKAFAMP